MRSALRLSGVTVRYCAGTDTCYASVVALSDIDLDVGCGETVGIVGAAGAGKSTLLRCAVGLVGVSSGRIGWFGARRAALPPASRTVYVPSSIGMLQRLRNLRETAAPRIVALDDPLCGVEGAAYAELDEWLEGARGRGDAVLVSARAADAIARISSRIVTIRAGRVQVVTQQHADVTPARVAEATAIDVKFG